MLGDLKGMAYIRFRLNGITFLNSFNRCFLFYSATVTGGMLISAAPLSGLPPVGVKALTSDFLDSLSKCTANLDLLAVDVHGRSGDMSSCSQITALEGSQEMREQLVFLGTTGPTSKNVTVLSCNFCLTHSQVLFSNITWFGSLLDFGRVSG